MNISGSTVTLSSILCKSHLCNQSLLEGQASLSELSAETTLFAGEISCLQMSLLASFYLLR